MKKLNYLFPVLLSLFVFCSSCKKDSDDNSITVSEGCSASWKVNGTSYSESDLSLCVYLDGTLNLSASTTGGDFQLQINPITTTGTYVADPDNQNLDVIVLIKLSDGTRIGSADATVVVSELSSSKAKGTFSGNFFDIMDVNQTTAFVVTEGRFESNF